MWHTTSNTLVIASGRRSIDFRGKTADRQSVSFTIESNREISSTTAKEVF
jgi:hypothetical protein